MRATLTAKDFPAHIVALCKRLKDAGHEAWLVGGSVRDLLRERAAKDYDIATDAEPARVRDVFGKKSTIPTGEKHGTITVLVPYQGERIPVEVTTFRGEGEYSDGRRPDTVVFVRTLVEDLERRDFTMNAIAFDPIAERIEDPFAGRLDIERRLIRAVGDPIARFSEDGLRALRAVRFAAQLEFSVDPATQSAIGETRAVFRKVSAERVHDELVKILLCARPSIALDLLARSGLLADIIPELVPAIGHPQNRHHSHDVWQHTMATVDATPLMPGSDVAPHVARLSALLHDVSKPETAQAKEGAPGEFTFYNHDRVGADRTDAILRRLKFSTKERERTAHIVGHHMFWYSPEWTDGAVRRFMSRVGVEVLPELFALREGDIKGRGRDEDPNVELGALKARVQETLTAASALSVKDLAVDGKDVMRILGCPPSPIIGEILRALLERVLDDASLNVRDRLEPMVRELAETLPKR